jgi:hypothetical protein
MSLIAIAGAALREFGNTPLLKLGAGPFLSEFFKLEPSVLVRTMGWSNLLLLFCVKLLHTTVALSLPIPAGCVAPSLVLGAIMGRACAMIIPESMQNFLAPEGNFNGYACRLSMVGATAFCGSVCRVISVVVTFFELVGVPSLILPLAMATLAANYMGNKVGPSLFDSILVLKKVPAMPTLLAAKTAMKVVEDVMRLELLETGGRLAFALPRFATEDDVKRIQALTEEALSQGTSVPTVIPLIEEIVEGVKIYTGAVYREQLTAKGASPSRLEKLIQEQRLKDAKTDNGHVEQNDGSRSSSGSVDLLKVVYQGKMWATPTQVGPKTTVRNAYLQAQSTHWQGAVMVVEHGELRGILTHDDIMKLAR